LRRRTCSSSAGSPIPASLPTVAETHELARSGKPSHRIERLQHIVNWFDKYLLGKTITDYDARHEQP
jgi:hypothetical protein